MIRICTWCKEKVGEKKPFEDKSKTHGICDTCLAVERRRVKKASLLSNPANMDSRLTIRDR